MRVGRVGEEELPELLPLVRGYCDWYGASPSDAALLALSRALLADPRHEGVQLLCRSADGAAVGFATIFWTWSTLGAVRVGTLNDLYVDEAARGSGAARALVDACLEECRRRGAARLEWQTAHDNARAQRFYDRLGARRSADWLDYSLPA